MNVSAKTPQPASNGVETNDLPRSGALGETNGHVNVRRRIDSDGICTLVFDRPGSAANVFDHATLLELDSHLDWIERSPFIRGVILWSAKETIFVAGADLRVLAQAAADDPGAGSVSESRIFNHYPPAPRSASFMELVQLGQGVFGRLAALPVPTIAAIHGACMGGGFELALACARRLASASPATRIGLPETKLGIVPAWGGCTRLPRLVGIPKALDMILTGKAVRPEAALKLGLIDEVVPRERMLDVARSRILNPVAPSRPSLMAGNNPVSAMLIRSRSARLLAMRTRGNYPAQFEALEIVTRSVSIPVDHSLALEREAIGRLARGAASHNLVRVFLGVQKLKKRDAHAAAEQPPAHRAAVIGAGVMGAGIAHWLSSRGLNVILRDTSLEKLVSGMDSITQLYADGVRRNHLSELEARDGRDRIFAAASDVPLRDVDVVIEAATEKLSLKQDIFRCLAARTSPSTLLATNTSALSINELASATSAPERIVGLHFFNPVHRMELVEVVVGNRTSPEMRARAVDFVRQIGKAPILVQDSPGFVVNRVLMPYLVEAILLFDAGVSAKDIDEAMLDFGMPMGPLRLLDEIGVDVAESVARTLASHFSRLLETPPLIHKMLEASMTGRKSGRGFYTYPHEKLNPELTSMRSIHRHVVMPRDELAERMSLLMVNEAARCLEEKVAASAEDIDLALVLGAGFAPFRGGPLRHADATGLAAVVSALRRLADADLRFKPCALLEQAASAHGTLHTTTPEAAHENTPR